MPKPFKGALEWLADRLRPLGRFFQRVFGPILDLPGGTAVLAALLVGAGAAAAVWLAGRRSRAAVVDVAAWPLVDTSLDPAERDRLADGAEGRGDLDAAVRLRYEAGLLRLARADRLVLRPDTTAEGAARQVDLPVMDRLTRDFEEVVYGGRAATRADVDRSRAGWTEVLAVGSRR